MHLPEQPIRFTRVDETNSGDHPFYEDGDNWLFLFEKTSGRDYSFSDTNNLISNLKKAVTSSPTVLNHKSRAIQTCATALRQAINAKWLDTGTLVPIPPSKAPTDPLYDNRMERVCELIRPNNIDVRNLVVQNQSMEASHERNGRPRITIDELIASYSINENITAPEPSYIGIVDDMMTAGTHYRAMHHVLSHRFPNAKLFGCFIARRILPDDDTF
jgi:hypothetical protein